MIKNKNMRTLSVVLVVIMLFGVQIATTLSQDVETDITYKISPILFDIAEEELGVSLSATSAVAAFSTESVESAASLPDGVLDGRNLSNKSSFSLDMSNIRIADGKVLIDTYSTTNPAALLAELQALGMTGGSLYGNVVSGYLPITSITALGTVSNLAFATASQPIVNVGSVDSEAPASMVTDVLTTLYGLDGTGITIGILSDSFDCSPTATTSYADDVASGDLPNDVLVIDEIDNCTNAIDEGRAMAQLVYDIVPGAKIQFYSAFDGFADFANGILALDAAGSDIIVDDIGYFAESWFQDAIVAQAVDIVAGNGKSYFSSAGNAANDSYEGTYTASSRYVLNFDSIGDLTLWRMHDFDTGAGEDVVNFSTTNDTIRIYMQWSDPYASITGGVGADVDFDVLFYGADAPAGFIGCIFLCFPNLGGDPFEGAISGTTGGNFGYGIGLRIQSFDPSDFSFDPTEGDAVTDTVKTNHSGWRVEYTGAPTSQGHSVAELGIGVGAAFWGTTPAFGITPPEINSFSSYGGTAIVFDTAGNSIAPNVRNNPQITAPDGINNTFFISDSTRDPDTFPNFFGTSAAAPNAAAFAALLLQAEPDLTPAEIEAALIASAIDIVATNDVGGPPANRNIALAAGFDNASGFGLIQGPAALCEVACAIVAFETDASSTPEDVGTVPNIVLTTVDGNPTANATTVTFSIIGGNAGNGSDFSLTTTLAIAAGTANGTVVPMSNMAVIDDFIFETDETVDLQIGDVDNGFLFGQATHTLTIIENDDAPVGDPVETVGGTGTTDNLLANVTSLPATGEAPWYRNALVVLIAAISGVSLLGGVWAVRRNKA